MCPVIGYTKRRQMKTGGRVAALNNKFEAEGFSTELLPYLFKAYDVENLNDLEIKIEKIRAEIKREWEKGAYMKYHLTNIIQQNI